MMKREDIKVGQKVSFCFSGSKYLDDIGTAGHARTVYGVVHKLHRVNIEVWEESRGFWMYWLKKPSELTIDKI